MKNQNIVFIAIAFALAFALAPVTQATPCPQGGCVSPTITIHSAGNILRGETGSFVLEMKPVPMSGGIGGMYVNFKVSGTAIAGVDYVLLVSPAHVGQSGYGVIQVKTLPDPRGSSFRQALSVIVTLEPGAGYAVGAPSSAKMMIEPSNVQPCCQ